MSDRSLSGESVACVVRGADGKGCVAVLADGTRISVGREPGASGRAWLEIGRPGQISVLSPPAEPEPQGPRIERSAASLARLMADCYARGVLSSPPDRNNFTPSQWAEENAQAFLPEAARWLAAGSTPSRSAQYEAFAGQLSQHCICREGPCVGVLGGGLCDGLLEQEREKAKQEEEDFP